MQIPLIARSQTLNADFPHRNLVDFLLQHPVVDVKAFWTSDISLCFRTWACVGEQKSLTW